MSTVITDIDIINKIKSAVINQLNDAHGLYSLKIQNHIYGCFIVMEDIAQKAVDISGTVLQGDKFSFDFDKQFSEIGLRYGFVMDTQLLLDTFTPEYKEAWVGHFKCGTGGTDLSMVDNIEDAVIEAIQQCVRPADAFFLNAVETGSLTQEWVGIVIDLLHNPVNSSETTELSQNNSDEDDVKLGSLNPVISHAKTEKPIHRHRRLEVTRRNKGVGTKDIGAKGVGTKGNDSKQLVKKSLAKTRRLHRE